MIVSDRPFVFDVVLPGGCLSRYDCHVVRTLSSLAGQYADQRSYAAALADGDPTVYEVYDIRRPQVSGELLHGLSVVHPGKVGDEYYMTKGHFHEPSDTAELYYCLQGQGMMLMETAQGEWAAEELCPGRVLYVPPNWAHRSVNTGAQEDLITFFVYPGHAGHDYATIERQGFRKLIVERAGQPAIVDNPRWCSPEAPA